MSTSETATFAVGPCPCNAGRIVQRITTQDNPWSSADVSYGIECSRCESEWRIPHYGGSITNKASEQPYLDAQKRQRESENELRSLVDPLIDEYFVRFSAPSMAAELREMQRLKISRMNIVQFRKEKRFGSKPSELTYPLNNSGWITALAEKAGVEERCQQLLERYSEATAAVEKASKAVVRVQVPLG